MAFGLLAGFLPAVASPINEISVPGAGEYRPFFQSGTGGAFNDAPIKVAGAGITAQIFFRNSAAVVQSPMRFAIGDNLGSTIKNKRFLAQDVSKAASPLPVPEPGFLSLIGVGLLGLALLFGKRSSSG